MYEGGKKYINSEFLQSSPIPPLTNGILVFGHQGVYYTDWR